MSLPSSLGPARPSPRPGGRLPVLRLLLPVSWLLAAAGYYAPWVAHPTAALTLGGVDMAEFVKFLPPVQDGSLELVRQLFYLPPVAVVVTVALLAWSRALRYPWPLRWLFLAGALPVSLQLLPPAWSPASLLTPEFRLQTAALVACWLLLALSWLLGRLPAWMGGGLSTMLALAAVALPSWQFELAKPAVDAVYGRSPAVGWGFFVGIAGLVLLAIAGIGLVLWALRGDSRLWRSR
jgi:hypothetical protein